MDRELEVLAASYGNTQWINSFVAKGPIVIEWKNKEPWFVIDKKTEGYPFKGFVGRYILTGGNWVKSDRTAEVSPVHIYRMKIKDELEKNWSGVLLSSIRPFADYIEIYTYEDHGNDKTKETLKATNGTVYTLASIVGATIQGEEIQNTLKPSEELTPSHLLGKIRSRDVGESKDPGVAVLTLDDLRDGHINNFAAGDGEKLGDYISEVYGTKLSIKPTKGRSFRLYQSSPSTPFADRKELLPHLRTNPLREEITDPKAPFASK